MKAYLKFWSIVVNSKQIDCIYTPVAGQLNQVSFSLRTKLRLTIFLQYWDSASFAFRKARWLIIRAIFKLAAVAKVFIKKSNSVMTGRIFLNKLRNTKEERNEEVSFLFEIVSRAFYY